MCHRKNLRKKSPQGDSSNSFLCTLQFIFMSYGRKNVQTIRKHASFIILHFPHNCAQTYKKSIEENCNCKKFLPGGCVKSVMKRVLRVKKLNSAISASKRRSTSDMQHEIHRRVILKHKNQNNFKGSVWKGTKKEREASKNVL